MLGEEDHPASETDWLIDQLTAFAVRNDLEFTWHSASDESNDASWIGPALEKLFASRDCTRERGNQFFASWTEALPNSMTKLFIPRSNQEMP